MKYYKTFSYPFEFWHRPIKILATILFIFALTVFNIENEMIRGIVGFLLFLSLLVVLISIIILLVRKQWREVFYTFLAIVGAFLVFALLAPAIVAD